jgi:hypothetical protein
LLTFLTKGPSSNENTSSSMNDLRNKMNAIFMGKPYFMEISKAVHKKSKNVFSRKIDLFTLF